MKVGLDTSVLLRLVGDVDRVLTFEKAAGKLGGVRVLTG
jgi:hypothetical protein